MYHIYDIGKYQINLNGSVWNNKKEYIFMLIIIFDNNDRELERKRFYIDGKIYEDIFKNMTEEDVTRMYIKPKNHIFKLELGGKYYD